MCEMQCCPGGQTTADRYYVQLWLGHDHYVDAGWPPRTLHHLSLYVDFEDFLWTSADRLVVAGKV
jgi:hypothetical protein